MTPGPIGFEYAAIASHSGPTGPSAVPRTFAVRSDLVLDRSADRVVGRVLDRTTGQVVRQYPDEAILRLLAASRAQFGPLLRIDV